MRLPGMCWAIWPGAASLIVAVLIACGDNEPGVEPASAELDGSADGMSGSSIDASADGGGGDAASPIPTWSRVATTGELKGAAIGQNSIFLSIVDGVGGEREGRVERRSRETGELEPS